MVKIFSRAEGARKILRFNQADNDFLQCHQGIRIVQGPNFFARLRRELIRIHIIILYDVCCY